MRRMLLCFAGYLMIQSVALANTELVAAIENVRAACGGISNELNHMKQMAGINTAITGVGTVAGGVALGIGIAKARVDSQVDEYQEIIDALTAVGAKQVTSVEMFYDTFADALAETGTKNGTQFARQLKNKQSQLEQKSKNLGNWRTGTLAVSTATNIAGAVIAGGNKVMGNLKSQIDGCVATVKTLVNVRLQAYVAKSDSDAELKRAEDIVNACGEWEYVNLDSINKRSTAATVASGVGAGLGVVGTVTSASANSNKIRDGDANKEKNLNTAANVLAGGTTVVSGVATVFNATQIAAIKNAVRVAENCQGVLK